MADYAQDADLLAVWFRCFRSRSDVTWLGCHIGHIVSPQLAPRYRSRQLPFSLSSPSPSLAPASRHHGPPSTPTPSQDAPQPPIDRPRVPAPRVIFVPQHPVASLISHFPFKMSSMSSSLSAAFGHPQDTVGFGFLLLSPACRAIVQEVRPYRGHSKDIASRRLSSLVTHFRSRSRFRVVLSPVNARSRLRPFAFAPAVAVANASDSVALPSICNIAFGWPELPLTE
ncbi:hypothetical protein EDB84DRAFT_1563653 [Lactarius hengduanensis]|nr:hypothetical protein EDB84DRAFT_1563653 [Lactarius hengduanensis]